MSLICICLSCFAQRNDSPLYTFHIDYNYKKGYIREEAYSALDSIVECVKRLDSTIILIAVHAGSKQIIKRISSTKLTEERAINIENYFIEKGIDPKKLRHKGYEFRHPIVINPKTSEDFRKNSRVELYDVGRYNETDQK